MLEKFKGRGWAVISAVLSGLSIIMAVAFRPGGRLGTSGLIVVSCFFVWWILESAAWGWLVRCLWNCPQDVEGTSDCELNCWTRFGKFQGGIMAGLILCISLALWFSG